MTIYRDGEAITLTDRELFDAYYEQRDKFDIEDIDDYFDCEYVNEDEWKADTGMTAREWLATFGAKAARQYRKYLDNYDDYWLTARSEAISYVMAHGREEEI